MTVSSKTSTSQAQTSDTASADGATGQFGSDRRQTGRRGRYPFHGGFLTQRLILSAALVCAMSSMATHAQEPQFPPANEQVGPPVAAAPPVDTAPAAPPSAEAVPAQPATAEPASGGVSSTNPDPDSRGRATAVALNYCRASFHRIRRYESKRVLIEEREKILDNIDLNGIGDEAVIKLYTAVLDEIGQINIADREYEVLKTRFNAGIQRQIGTTLFVAAAQMATASLQDLVRTGVNSWLDYRDLNWTREMDSWKVEKARMQAVVDKSSTFLDTFWKLTQEKNIPDRWLVRGNDLDDLEEAVREPDLQKRMRILRRMEPFMECYPPYWYYVARTQQGLGELVSAAATYDRVADLAHGHFRRDDMLAASLANRAIIQSVLGDAAAERTALAALRYSPGVWEANLMCSQVLEKSGRLHEAEDAILRNLDVGLEREHSTVALLGLHLRQRQHVRLAALLADDGILNAVPALSLVQCVAAIGVERTPGAAIHRLRESLRVAIDPGFGLDDVVVACGTNWQPTLADVEFLSNVPSAATTAPAAASVTAAPPAEVTTHPTGFVLHRFVDQVEGGSPLSRNDKAAEGTLVRLKYRSQGTASIPVLEVVMGPALPVSTVAQPMVPWWPAASPAAIRYGQVFLDLSGQSPGMTPQVPSDSSALTTKDIPASSVPVDVATPDVALPTPTRDRPTVPAESSEVPPRRPRITIIGVRSAAVSSKNGG